MNIFELISTSGVTGWLFAFLTLLILSEIVFILIIRTTKREHDTSLVNYTVAYKLIAWLMAFGALILIGVVLLIIREILLVGGVVGLIVGYIAINYWLAKKFAKHETKEEYEIRKAKKDKEEAVRIAELTKFKIGDKVRIKAKNRIKLRYDYDDEEYRFKSNNKNKSIRWSDSEMKKYKGKVLTIDYIDEEGDIAVKEDNHNNWYSDAILDKVRGAGKVNKRKKARKSNKRKR